jgi:hypothetical protein
LAAVIVAVTSAGGAELSAVLALRQFVVVQSRPFPSNMEIHETPMSIFPTPAFAPPRGFVAPALALFLMQFVLASTVAAGSPPAAETFKTPEEAAQALFDAAKSKNQTDILHVLGPVHERWILSGDAAMDKETAERFASAYEKKSEIVREGAHRAKLLVGPDAYPVPFPIVEKNCRWRFDARAGRQEMLLRRIGRDELAAIDTLRAVFQAHKDAAAGKTVTDKGEGVRLEPGFDSGPEPHHGYYFRVLSGQAQAPGGGISVLAYPAKYGVSGIMSFMIGEDGAVVEADLGASTAELATKMERFQLDERWKKA